MNLFRLLVPLFVCLCLCVTVRAAEATATPPEKKAAATPTPEPKKPTVNKDMHKKHGPGLLDDLWAKIGPAKKATPAPGTAVKGDAVERQVGNKKLWLTMSVEPQPIKLTDARQIKVTMHVANKSAKLVQLEFPTTQRIEVLIRNSGGKMVSQWSEDHTFVNEPGMVSINPGEHLEYAASLSTRDMAAGQSYTVEAFFPNYDSLRLQRVVPVEK